MPVERRRSGYFYYSGGNPNIRTTADNQTIAGGATLGTDSEAVDLQGHSSMGIRLVATGANAFSSGVITFSFVTSLDGTNFEDESNAVTETITVAATAEISKTVWYRVEHLRSIKVAKVVNGDATYAVDVNVQYFMEERV